MNAGTLWPTVMSAIALTHRSLDSPTAIAFVCSADIALIIGPFVGGFLYDWKGRVGLFGFCLAVSVAVAIIALVANPVKAAAAYQPEEATSTDLIDSAKDNGGSWFAFAEFHFVVQTVSILIVGGSNVALDALLPLYWSRFFKTAPHVIGSLFGPAILAKLVGSMLLSLVTTIAPYLADHWHRERKRLGATSLLGAEALSSVSGESVTEKEVQEAATWLMQLLLAVGVLLSGIACSAIVTVDDIIFQTFMLALACGGLGLVESSSYALSAAYVTDRGWLESSSGRAFAIKDQAYFIGMLVMPLAIGAAAGQDGEDMHVPLAATGALHAVLLPATLLTMKSYAAAVRGWKDVTAHKSLYGST
jgi:MFS family permease